MVVFVCSKCNESLKKKVVEQHFNNCKNSLISCVDCSKDFTRDSYIAHTTCITEKEKYDKPNFQAKLPKGASKQLGWTEQVHLRLQDFQCQSGLAKLLVKKILDSNNVPRNKSKFQNFLKSNFRFVKQGDVDNIWDCINKAIETTAELQESNLITKTETVNTISNILIKPNELENCKRKHEESVEVEQEQKNPKKLKKEAENVLLDEIMDESKTNKAELNKLSFRETVQSILHNYEKPMRIKKLKKKAFESFKHSSKFDKQIHTDDALEKFMNKTIRSKKRFTLSEDEKHVSLAVKESVEE